MKAGQTNLQVGTKVRLVTKEKEINGKIGTITHPFAFGETSKGWVGIYLDNDTSPYGTKFNVRVSECKTI